MGNSKRDFSGGWKVVFALCLTAIAELAVIDISQLPPNLRWIYLFVGIALLILSYAVVNVLWVLIEKAIYKWRISKQQPKNRNLQLVSGPQSDNTVPLFLNNKEPKREILWISRIQVANNPLTWMPISSTGLDKAGLTIKKGERKQVLSLKWDRTHRYFLVADYQNDDFHKVFSVGVEKFDIVITYGFNERGNEWIKRFSVIVSFDENGVISVLEIKHAD